MQASVRLEHQLLAVEAEHTVHAMLELVAPPAPGTGERPPLHLALVIDRSGSMAGAKLETTKRCAAFLVQRLAPTDQLALITYDDQVQLRSPLVPVQPAQHLPLIATIHDGGQTNLSGGWLKGLEELQRGHGPGARKILLLTDGLANVGVTDHGALVAMAKNAAESDVGTTTIGFGEGFAEELLTGMADVGRGSSYYAATPDEAPGIFAQEFEGLVSLVAQNVSVEIRPAQQVVMLGVLNDYPAVEVPGGVQVQLGDAYGEDRRRIVFELHVPQLASLGVAKVADVIVRYVSVGEQIEAHELTLPIVVNLVSADEAAAAKPDQEVSEEVVVLKAARAQEEARDRADKGDFDGAERLLKMAASELRSRAPGSSKAEELLQQADQLDANVAFMSAPSYTASSRKQMHYQARQSKRRRK
jgi:Ca-activated chloride channel homolog